MPAIMTSYILLLIIALKGSRTGKTKQTKQTQRAIWWKHEISKCEPI